MYTTIAKIRQVSGFVGNSNISDAYISSMLLGAESLINSYLSDAYTLPIGKYYTQTITFSGTGSGNGTMTITINGEDYVVAITGSLTASQAADLFRVAALENSSFVTDGIGSGATVALYSIDANDATDVTVTTATQTVSGITATNGTVTEIAPPLLEVLATEITAASLLINEYGPESQDTDKDGYKRLAMWEKILKNIANKTEKVFDFAGQELPRSTTRTVVFYPDAASRTGDDPTANKATMNKVF